MVESMAGGGSSPYGTTSSAQYGDVTSMLDSLGLTYGLDGNRLSPNRGGNANTALPAMSQREVDEWGDMESADWGSLEAPVRQPQKPGGSKPQRLQQRDSPRKRHLR